MLEKLLRSNAEVKVLGVVLFSDGLHLREIARRAEVSPSEAKRELDSLASTGILKAEKKGNLVLFYKNGSCPFLAELRGLYLKTEGIFSELGKALAEIKGIKFAFGYGSFAHGEEREKSDVDLLIVGKPGMDGLHRKIMEIEKRVGREINYSVYSAEEFHRKATLSGFLKEVMQGDKIFMRGTGDEFKRFAEEGHSQENGARPTTSGGMPKGRGEGYLHSKGKPGK
jgi:predicted nucleotidyltransferase